MQVACKAFIAPDSAPRSRKERYTHALRSPRRARHAGCIMVWNAASEATDKIGMGRILPGLLPKCDIPVAPADGVAASHARRRRLPRTRARAGPASDLELISDT